MSAWLTARLTMADPKSFPSYDSLVGRNAEAPRDEVSDKLFARLKSLHEAQEKAARNETQPSGGSEAKRA